jgi:hypothetical protein
MTVIQQGWVFCADGYGWLQRLTEVGVLGPDGLCVDISELTYPPEPQDAWQALRSEGGWYLQVPTAMVNALAVSHGGAVDAMSSWVGLG